MSRLQPRPAPTEPKHLSEIPSGNDTAPNHSTSWQQFCYSLPNTKDPVDLPPEAAREGVLGYQKREHKLCASRSSGLAQPYPGRESSAPPDTHNLTGSLEVFCYR